MCIGYVDTGQNAKVKGVILDNDNHPVSDVNISVGNEVSQSDVKGFFEIAVTSNKKVVLIFTHISLKMITLTVDLEPNEVLVFNPVMNNSEEQMGEV